MNKKIFLLLILLLGFALRFSAIRYGLPYIYHADEPIVVNHAVAYGTGDLNPHFFKIPPLVSYLLFFCYGIYFAIGKLLGLFHSLSDFQDLFFSNPGSFYLIARIIFGVLAGTASIFVLHRLISKYFGETKALLSAFLFAVCFLHVRDSHYIYLDIPLVLVLISAFFIFFRILESRALKWHVITGILVGLAAAVKYNGAALVIPYLFAAFLSLRFDKSLVRFIFFAALSAAGIFILLNPHSVLDFPYFLSELRTQSASQGGVGWTHHFTYSLAGGLGWPLLIIALAGIVKSFLNRNSKKLTVSIFALSYYAVLALAGQPYDRYVLPLLPFLIFLAADFIVDLTESRTPSLVLLLAITALPNLTKAILFDHLMQTEDTRTQAKQWVEKNIPPETPLALGWDFYMPRLRFSKKQLLQKKEMALRKGHFSKAQIRKIDYWLQETNANPGYQLNFLSGDQKEKNRFLFATPLVPFDLGTLKQRGIRYVLIPRDREDQLPTAFYERLRKEGKLVAEFNPYQDPTRRWPYDQQPLTGGPFLFSELLHRKCNGLPIEIYEI